MRQALALLGRQLDEADHELGIDVGTSGCKSAVFSHDGRLLSLAYAEYDFQKLTGIAALLTMWSSATVRMNAPKNQFAT